MFYYANHVDDLDECKAHCDELCEMYEMCEELISLTYFSHDQFCVCCANEGGFSDNDDTSRLPVTVNDAFVYELGGSYVYINIYKHISPM